MSGLRALGFVLAILSLVATGPGRAAGDAGPPRFALVVGEAAYPGAQLPTAAADAGLMASSLMQAGFAVTAVADVDGTVLRKTIAAFAAKVGAAGPGTMVVCYVSGYGLQYAGENWLVPPGARIDDAAEIPKAAFRLADLVAPLAATPAAARLFLFDVARENPFARKGDALAGGLALATAPVGSIFAFNAAPGTVAPADVPPFGTYASALAEAMQTPGLALGDLLRRARLRTVERSNGAAVPFDDGSADPSLSLYPGQAGSPKPAAVTAAAAPPAAFWSAVWQDTLPAYMAFATAFPGDPLAARAQAMAAVRREALFWSEALRTNTPRAYWTYQRRYPRGPHLADARRQLFALHAGLEPPPRFDIVTFEGLPPPSEQERAISDRPVLTFSDGDAPALPAPMPAMLPPTRSAFFDLAAPPPLAPAGALPLPFPVPTEGLDRAPGRIEQPAVPGGPLVSTMVAGQGENALVTSRGTAPVSRVNEANNGGVRTVVERSASNALLSETTIATARDGVSTITQFGPGHRMLTRSIGRDIAAGAHAVTLFDAADQPVATTIVAAGGVVAARGVIPGRALPPRFVLLPTLDAKGVPMIAPANEAVPPGVAQAPAGPAKPDDAKRDETNAMAAAETPGAKPPALPAAAGLTGEPPRMDLPPPPPTPPFDATAAPVAATPPNPPAVSLTVKPAATAASPPPAAPEVKPPAPSITPTPPKLATLPPPSPATDQSAATDTSKPSTEAHLPKEPPLPPPRSRADEQHGRRKASR